MRYYFRHISSYNNYCAYWAVKTGGWSVSFSDAGCFTEEELKEHMKRYFFLNHHESHRIAEDDPIVSVLRVLDT